MPTSIRPAQKDQSPGTRSGSQNADQTRNALAASMIQGPSRARAPTAANPEKPPSHKLADKSRSAGATGQPSRLLKPLSKTPKGRAASSLANNDTPLAPSAGAPTVNPRISLSPATIATATLSPGLRLSSPAARATPSPQMRARSTPSKTPPPVATEEELQRAEAEISAARAMLRKADITSSST